ncbi:MAG: hypothetical protein Q8P86_01185 [bacterium]|nr:hypothetical protein [bacterium]
MNFNKKEIDMSVKTDAEVEEMLRLGVGPRAWQKAEMKAAQDEVALPDSVAVEPLASAHDHFREGTTEEDRRIQKDLLANAIEGGADTVGAMPNTLEGLKTVQEVASYIGNLRRLIPQGKSLFIIPYVAITEDTTEWDINDCKTIGINDGKILPKYRTTNSDYGVVRYGKLLPVIKRCGEVGMRVHGHFEHPSPTYSNDDAEFACLPIVLTWLEETNAKIIWEHGTDGRCVPLWRNMAKSDRFFVTITPQHLLETADTVYGDVRAVCKPSYGDENDRAELVRLVGEDLPWVMAGPDVAPHDKKAKHPQKGRCSCGAYHAPYLLPLYAEALKHLFKTDEGRQTFVNFTSRNLRKLHKLPPASKEILLIRRPFVIPLEYKIGSWTVEPFRAGQTIGWSLGKEY